MAKDKSEAGTKLWQDIGAHLTSLPKAAQDIMSCVDAMSTMPDQATLDGQLTVPLELDDMVKFAKVLKQMHGTDMLCLKSAGLGDGQGAQAALLRLVEKSVGLSNEDMAKFQVKAKALLDKYRYILEAAKVWKVDAGKLEDCPELDGDVQGLHEAYDSWRAHGLMLSKVLPLLQGGVMQESLRSAMTHTMSEFQGDVIAKVVSTLMICQVLCRPDKFPDQGKSMERSMSYVQKRFNIRKADFCPNIVQRVDALAADKLRSKGSGEEMGPPSAAASSKKRSRPRISD